MMSKNSFLANLKENNKRRVWLWIISGLFWFIYYPVGMMMILSRQNTVNQVGGYTEAVSKGLLTEAAKGWLGSITNLGGLVFLVCVIAAVCAIQGFSYLYHKRKVDFYHSIPVKKSRRFAVIYLNGVLIFFLPYLVSLLLAMAVAGINGAMDGVNFGVAAVSLGCTVLLFLGIYGLAMIAVMLTGNLIITLFATAIFVFYEPLVKVLLQAYCDSFYKYFAYQSVKTHLYLSPVGQLIEGLEAESFGEALPHILAMAAMAAGFAAIAWFCYMKRPSEAAGKAMAFAKTKGVVKVLLVIPFALGIGYIIMDLIGETPIAMMVFGMVMAVIIGSCTIEVIYEMDIRAVLRKKYQMLLSGAGVAVIFLIFCFDLTGYDRWAPDPDKLEDAVVLFMDDMYGNQCIDENFHSVNNVDYWLSMPGIHDIDAICRFSDLKSEEENIWCSVCYRMKNGKEIWRNFSVSGEEEELLNRIVGSKEYREAKCQLYNDDIYAGIKGNRIEEFTFSTGFKVENLAPEGLDEFREAYLKDLEKADYSMMHNEFVCGNIRIEVEKDTDGRTVSRGFEYNIYPSYTNTIAFLEEKGVYDGNYLDVEGIASITVENYHSELAKAAVMQAKADGLIAETVADMDIGNNYNGYTVTKNFNEEEQIRDIAQALYPRVFDDSWLSKDLIDYDYDVTVMYKDGTVDSVYYRGSGRAYLMADRIPDWLEKETAYE